MKTIKRQIEELIENNVEKVTGIETEEGMGKERWLRDKAQNAETSYARIYIEYITTKLWSLECEKEKRIV